MTFFICVIRVLRVLPLRGKNGLRDRYATDVLSLTGHEKVFCPVRGSMSVEKIMSDVRLPRRGKTNNRIWTIRVRELIPGLRYG